MRKLIDKPIGSIVIMGDKSYEVYKGFSCNRCHVIQGSDTCQRLACCGHERLDCTEVIYLDSKA